MDGIASLHIEILTTRERIEQLRSFWDSCAPCRDADLDFFLFITELFSETERPHVVVLYEHGTPRAVLIARLDRVKPAVRLGYHQLAMPTLRVLNVVHGGWLGDITGDNAKLLTERLMHALDRGEADAVFFHAPPTDAALSEYARHAPRWWQADHAINAQTRRVRDLPEKGVPFSKSLSQNERYQQRKRARILSENFKSVEILHYQTAADIDRLMDDAERIAATSYQRRLNVGFAPTAVVRARLEFEAARGWLRGSVLYLDERPAAFWIGSLRNGTFLSEYLSFDAAFSDYAPGLYLIMATLESLHENESSNHARVIDFGIGDAPYKERLATRHWQEANIYIFASRPKPLMVNGARWFAGAFNGAAKNLMAHADWLKSAKRKWRSGARQSK